MNSTGFKALMMAATAAFFGRKARADESKRSDVERHGKTRRPWIRRQSCPRPEFPLRASAFPEIAPDFAGLRNLSTRAQWAAHEKRMRKNARRCADRVGAYVVAHPDVNLTDVLGMDERGDFPASPTPESVRLHRAGIRLAARKTGPMFTPKAKRNLVHA